MAFVGVIEHHGGLTLTTDEADQYAQALITQMPQQLSVLVLGLGAAGDDYQGIAGVLKGDSRSALRCFELNST